MTQRHGMGRDMGGGFRMGNMCTPVADACWCMAKPIQYCKVKIIIIIKCKKLKKIKYLLPFSGLPFHFVGGFLCCSKPFKFNIVSFCFWFPFLLIIVFFFIAGLYSEKKVMIYLVFMRWIPSKPSFIAWCFSLHILLVLSCSCGSGFLMIIFKYTDDS